MIRPLFCQLAGYVDPRTAAGSVPAPVSRRGVQEQRPEPRIPGSGRRPERHHRTRLPHTCAPKSGSSCATRRGACQTMQRLASDELLRDLPFEFHTVNAMFCHGLHFRKPGKPGQFIKPICPPSGAHSRAEQKSAICGARMRPPRGLLPSGGLMRARRFSEGISANLSGAALCETIAVAVHLDDADVVGNTIEQRTGQALGPQRFRPFVER